MKTFSKAASVVLALTIVQCACGICANAEETTPDYTTCKDGIHYTDTTVGNTTIDVKTAVAAALNKGITNYTVAVNKVDSINSEFNAGTVYFLENGTKVTAVKGLPGVTSTIGKDTSAAIADQTATNGKITTKLPNIAGITPVIDTAVKTDDTIGVQVDNTKGTVIGRALIGTTTPDTAVVTATNKFGTVTSTTTVSDVATVATGTPKAIAQQTIASTKDLAGKTPFEKMVALINVGRFVGTTDTTFSNSLTTAIGGKSVVSVTDVNDVTNTTNLQNGLGFIANQGEAKTTTTATPTVPEIVSKISGLIPATISQNITAAAGVKTTTGAAAVSADGKSISASTGVTDTASVSVNGNTLVDHSGSATITNKVTPNANAAGSILNQIVSTVSGIASGKLSVADAVKGAATAAIPDTITVSGNSTRNIDVTFGSTGAQISSGHKGNVTISATNNTLGTASTSVDTNGTTTITVPSASSIIGSLFPSGKTSE